jgi:hypothetical protein
MISNVYMGSSMLATKRVSGQIIKSNRLNYRNFNIGKADVMSETA